MSRVLLHSLVFSPDSVSTAYLMTELAVELKRLGHSVTVLTTTPHYNLDNAALARQPIRSKWNELLYHSECDGIPVWHVKVRPKEQRVSTRVVDYMRFHLLSLVVSLKVLGSQDIVIATSPPLTIGIISWLLGVRWHVSSVYKVAEIWPDAIIRQGIVRHPALIGMMRWLERFVYSRNTMVVPIAEQFKKVIRQRGVPERKLVVIPDFVDIEFYRPLPRVNPFAEAHGLLDDFVILYAGNIGLFQDWESVLFAAETVSYLPIQFVVVGDGSRRKWLTDQVSNRGLRNVKLLDYQPQELMPQINASCDICMIPMTSAGSLDGLPSKIYSIMASARPVLASAACESDMNWIIRESGCGRVVPAEDRQAYSDAVLAAFHDRDSLVAEGKRGRAFVEKNYSKQAIARKYDDLIRKLTAN